MTLVVFFLKFEIFRRFSGSVMGELLRQNELICKCTSKEKKIL